MRPLSGKRSSCRSGEFLPRIRVYCFLPADGLVLPFFSALLCSRSGDLAARTALPTQAHVIVLACYQPSAPMEVGDGKCNDRSSS